MAFSSSNSKNPSGFGSDINASIAQAKDKLGSIFNGLQGQLDRQKTNNPLQGIKDEFEQIYPTRPVYSNWYQALPYGFTFTKRDGTKITMFLPISPSDLTITTHYATNVITTLYGTVEEHSEQRYFDIAINGNTGFAPRYVDITAIEVDNKTRLQTNGRSAFSASETIPTNILGGFFAKTINVANQALNKAADVLAPQDNVTGINVTKTGYAAFHNLYKFFMIYKKDVSGETSTKTRTGGHPLVFFNYKDNNKYFCTVQKFILRKNADNPMIYSYSISLRAYKIQGLDEQERASGQFSLEDRLQELGLNGAESSDLFSDIKGISKGAKDFFGALKGGINIFGQ